MRPIHLLVTLMVSLVPGLSPSAEAPAVEWKGTFGGGFEETGRSVAQAADGGIAVVGWTRSFGAGDMDVYLVKLDVKGRLEFTATYGGARVDGGASVVAKEDGGFVIAGWTKSFGAGDTDGYLIRTDREGREVWARTFGTEVYEGLRCVRSTPDGGYILTGLRAGPDGSFPGDVYLVKSDAEGREAWAKTFGGALHESGEAVVPTEGGGYFVVGTQQVAWGASEDWDAYAILTDALGNEVWAKGFDFRGTDYVTGAALAADGSFVIAGYGGWTPAGGQYDGFLLKVDPWGKRIWTRAFGGAGSDGFRSVTRARDAGFVVCGWTSSYGDTSNDVLVVKVTEGGATSWWNTLGTKNVEDEGLAVAVGSDGGYVVAGSTRGGGQFGNVQVFKLLPEPLRFRRGDVDVDGVLNLTDPIVVLRYLLWGDPTPPCIESCDADDDGKLNVEDATRLLRVLFLDDEPLVGPGPECGPDPTPDDLGCASFHLCG